MDPDVFWMLYNTLIVVNWCDVCTFGALCVMW